MPNSTFSKQMGRVTFLLSSVLVAVLCGGAFYLLRSHAGNRHLLLAAAYGLVVLEIGRAHV